MLHMTKQERLSWVELVVEVYIAWYYFNAIGGFENMGQMTEGMGRLIALVIGLSILLSIAGEIAMSILAGRGDKAERDERDILFAARAGRNAYIILCIGIVFAIGHLLMQEGAAFLIPDKLRPPTTILAVHMMILALIAAAVANYASKIFYYRRGY